MADPLCSLLEDGCLTYQGDEGPAKRARAQAVLEQASTLAGADIFAAAMLGWSARVATVVADNPGAATARGGPHGWSPLMYVCYGRVHAPRHGESCLAAATVLLDAGADPNSFFLWDQTYRFTALTGCFGEGEGGPVALPEHVEGIAIAQLLLDRGASPNDGQALYNRMFTPGNVCLRMLIDAGLRRTDRINWPVGDKPGQTTMSYQLYHAARHDFMGRVELLIAGGVDVGEVEPGGQSVWRAAALGGHGRICARLEAAGAVPEVLSAVDSFTGDLRGGRVDRVKEALANDDTLFAQAEAAHGNLLSHALAAGDLVTIALIASLGVDLDRDPKEPAAHQAALHGQLQALQWVLAHGADPDRRDARFNATALGWAEHDGQAETAALLRALPQE